MLGAPLGSVQLAQKRTRTQERPKEKQRGRKTNEKKKAIKLKKSSQNLFTIYPHFCNAHVCDGTNILDMERGRLLRAWSRRRSSSRCVVESVQCSRRCFTSSSECPHSHAGHGTRWIRCKTYFVQVTSRTNGWSNVSCARGSSWRI